MRYIVIVILVLGLYVRAAAETWPEMMDVSEQSIDSAKIYNNLGVQMYGKGDFEKAVRYFYKSIELKKNLDYDEVRVANSLMNIGVIYRNMWEHDKAIQVLNQAEAIYVQNQEHNKLSKTLTNKGNVFADIGDNEKALEQYKQAVNLIDNTGQKNFRSVSVIYNNMGTIYMDNGEYENALLAFKQSIELLKKQKQWKADEKVIKNIAKAYVKLDSLGKAKEYFNLAFHTFKDEKASFNKGYFYSDFGKFLVDIGNRTRGLALVHEGAEIMNRIYEGQHPELANYYMKIGQIYLDEKNNDLALSHLQKALVALVPEFNDQDILKNPGRTNNSSDIILLSIFKRKAKALYNKYMQSSDVELLESGFQCSLIGLEILEDLKKGYVSEKSKLLLMEHEKDFYPTSVLIALKLYEITGYENYKEQAFLIAERGKASALLASLKTTNAREFGGIPEHLIQREFQLKKNIALYDEKLYEESKFNDPDSNRIKFWEKKLYGLKNQYYNLIDTFEKSYPGYYELKYKPETISSKSIQGILARNEAILEYCVSEENVITFLLTKDNFQYRIDTVSNEFYNRLSKFIQYLGKNQFSDHGNQNLQNFAENSSFFYNKLIEPIHSKLNNKSIVIIPDGLLAYLPFEILITDSSMVKKTNKKYTSFPYLIKSNPVSYAHSSTLLFKSKIAPGNYQQNLIAFAPKYNHPNSIPGSLPLIRQRYLNQLYPLPGSKEEVSLVSKIMDGHVFMDDEATEKNFKQNAGNYDILHLAMHTVIDNDDPLFTKMVFTQNDDSVEDNFLNTYELYNMDLSARMAVLSSCNTGRGKLQKGEGVISLARGFMYAGCPSVTMSLWEVEDKSGVQLMKYYYEYLKNGKSKSVALQQAKLKFLENADPLKAHPYFWSGYVVIGNHDSLYKSQYRIFLYVFAGMSVTAFGILILRRQRKRRRNIFPAVND